MLTTPKDPPGSAGTPASSAPGPVPDEPDPARALTPLQHEVALLTARQDVAEARGATADLADAARSPSERATPRGAASGRPPFRDSSPGRASPPPEPAGTIASWLAHHQLGVAVESIGEHVARALGVVPTAEREAVSAAVTEALVKSAREHLDRATAAELSRTPRSTLEQACIAALDRQAQLSIDEARRRNSLAGDDDAAPPHLPETGPNDGATSAERRINVLVTDDPLVTAGDLQAQLLSAQVSAHQAALEGLITQTRAARKDLEATLDCWVRATPLDHRAESPTGLVTTPHTLGLQLLELARSDLAVSHRTVSVGSHELVVRGAAALASNLGEHGRVVADELTTLTPESSPLIDALHDLLRQRAALAESTAALAGLVDSARSLAGVGEAEPNAAPPLSQAVTDTRGAGRRAVTEPGLRELARQALLHERAVQHVIDALGSLDRDLSAWMRRDDGGATPPLLAAVARERLHSEHGFSHLLVLQDEGLTADVVSRRSIMGDAGRRTHVGSARVSWLLLEVASGAVVHGGQSAPARTLVQDVGSGRTTSRSMSPLATTPLPMDAQHSLEIVAKFFAVAAGLAALILSVVALVHILLT